MPQWGDEDRQRMHDNSEALVARGDCRLDRGSTYRWKTKKRPNPKCPVQVKDVEKHFRSVWNPVPAPENLYIES
jgi:hypothetical protein